MRSWSGGCSRRRRRRRAAAPGPLPEWAQVHRELRRKDVTLALPWEESKATHPQGLQSGGGVQPTSVVSQARQLVRRVGSCDRSRVGVASCALAHTGELDNIWLKECQARRWQDACPYHVFTTSPKQENRPSGCSRGGAEPPCASMSVHVVRSGGVGGAIVDSGAPGQPCHSSHTMNDMRLPK